MKNIQVIDGARNCTYSLFAVTDRDFAVLFAEGEDVAFGDDLQARLDRGLLRDFYALSRSGVRRSIAASQIFGMIPHRFRVTDDSPVEEDVVTELLDAVLGPEPMRQ